MYVTLLYYPIRGLEFGLIFVRGIGWGDLKLDSSN